MFALESEMNYKMEMLNPSFHIKVATICSELLRYFRRRPDYRRPVQLSSVLGILHHHTADLKRFVVAPGIACMILQRGHPI